MAKLAANVTVTYNGVDLTAHFDPVALAEFDAELAAIPVRTIDVDPDWFVQQPALSGEMFINLTFVRVRLAAPIRSCLWRRNLDGGAWRKRGHPAHRSKPVG